MKSPFVDPTEESLTYENIDSFYNEELNYPDPFTSGSISRENSFTENLENEDFSANNNAVGPFYRKQVLSGQSSFLSAAVNIKATKLNQNQVQKSGVTLQAIVAVLNNFVAIPAIKQALIERNQANSGAPYVIDNSGNAVDSVFTEALHQFQMANYLNPKEHDGILGQSSLETLGFVKHQLRPRLNSSGFYGQKQLNNASIKSEVARQTGNEFTSENWYQFMLKPAWLGVKISDSIHLLLLRKLKEAEKWLLSQTKYQGMSPAALGKALGFNADTRYSGARLSANKQAMHGFGLAIDINVNGNPWIGAGWVKNDKVLLQERYRMIKALRNASGNQSLPGETVFAYLHSIAQSYGADSGSAYKVLKQRNDEFVAYLKTSSSELSYWKNSQSFGNRNPLNGFLNLHGDLVYALRQIAGLAWGAIDFGPKASGDIMHFDLRTIGAGKFLCEKIGGFVPKSGHPAITSEMSSGEMYYTNAEDDELTDETEHHEAIEEAEWEDDEDFYSAETEHDIVDDHEHYDSLENEVKDWSESVRLNKQYAQKLGWDRFSEKINDLVLPFSSLENVSLDEENLAQAVAAWQASQGFSEKDQDGVIGPVTWKQMQRALNLNGAESPQSGSVNKDVLAKILRYSSEIEKHARIFNVNPNVIRGIIAAESGGNVSSGAGKSGYKGLMQGATTNDQLNADTSIKTGTEKFVTFKKTILDPWLKKLAINLPSDRNENYLKACLSCYNAGPVTAMKAIQYASSAGNWEQWLSPEPYKRALLFSGGYAFYDTCTDNKTAGEKSSAREEYKRIRSIAWRKRPDPASWDSVKDKINSILKCSIERKYKNTPGYLDKFISYYRYFESNPVVAQEYEWEDEEQDFLQVERENEEANDGISGSENEYYSQYEYDSEGVEDYVKDISVAVNQNRHYASSLGWDNYRSQINELLLPFSGYQNMSLGEEAFAQAVAAWQSKQGFSSYDSDGIIGPITWGRMKPMLNPGGTATTGGGSYVPAAPGSAAPPVSNIYEFNRWHAQKILTSISNGIVTVNTGVTYNPKTQLEQLERGERVINVNPRTSIVQVLPIINHICEQAGLNNYREIIIGSFIRQPDSNGKCNGHCEGRCIDINFKGGSFSTAGSVDMVVNILTYLNSLAPEFKKEFGFGLPLQGNFFGAKNLPKFRSVDESNLIDPRLRQLIPPLGFVFPDNDNHFHIQVRWMTARI